MNQLVSIIVPIYKVPEKMLRRSIESCINQTWKNIEIILVDDESPDKCGEICEQYAKRDERIIVIHQKNKGLSGARNTGERKATGEWIMFVDGDDYINDKMCETLVNATKKEKTDIDIVCCSYIRKNNSILKPCELNGIEEKCYKDEECKYLQERVLAFNSHFSSAYCKLIKRKFLIDNNIFHNEELRQGAEGIEFNIRMFEKAKLVLVVKEFLYYYIYNEESISNKHNEKNHYYVLNCFETIKNNIMKSKNKERLLNLLYNRMMYVVITTAISGYFSPTNPEKYSVKKEKYKKYLEQPLIKESMKNANLENLDLQRKIILLLIKWRLFRVIDILGKTRRKSKNSKK